MNIRKKQIIMLTVLIVGIISLGIGFATFSNTLTISATANVAPDPDSFKVVFSNLNNDIDENDVVPTLQPNTLVATDGNIDNDNGPTLSDLSVTFIEPGQKVEYDLYIYNAGAYIAYLNSITFRGLKYCTPENNTVHYVDDACPSISMTVKLGNDIYTETVKNVTGHNLAVGGYETVKITLEYASNGARADGPFTVHFPDVSLYYVTIPGEAEEYRNLAYSEVFNNPSICDGHDAITIGEENFCVISSNTSSMKVITEKLLSNSISSPRQTTSSPAIVAFGQSQYWDSSYLPSRFGSLEYPYVYDEHSLLYPYIEAYKNYLRTLGADVLEARLISNEELTDLGCQYGQSSGNVSYCMSSPNRWLFSPVAGTYYWVGNAIGTDSGFMMCLNDSGDFSANLGHSPYGVTGYGIRPVIELYIP